MKPTTTILIACVLTCGVSATDDWRGHLGGPIIEAAFDKQSTSLQRSPLSRERMADEAQACAAFVNAYELSRDVRYRERANALYQVQLLSGRDLSDPIAKIMALYRASPFGDAQRFDWGGKDTPTHITAYNCYLRNSGPAVYRDECLRALEHGPRGPMIFYSLVPDDLIGRRR